MKDYLKFLEELLPHAKGEWRIGKEKFARKLDLELDANLSAEEVLKEAEADFARVERDMYVIARQLWSSTHPGKPLPPDDAKGRSDTIRLVLDRLNQDHGKPDDLVRDARATVERIKTFITENDILRLPEPDQCKIIEMPEFHRGNSVAYLNPAPPLDSKASSYYAVSPPPSGWDARRVETLLQEYNSRMLQILTIHEAYPGHYVQLAYSNRHPSLIRRVLFSGVFAEGWAVYTEQMMLDQGYGKGDPALRLNQLKWYLRSVANAILDHQMHCTNMSDAEALAFLTQRAFQSEGEAVGKIVRAKQSSCQLSTYFVGRTAFYRLRQQIQREMGDTFQLGRYHEAVLDQGTLPVKYLPELVRERLKHRAEVRPERCRLSPCVTQVLNLAPWGPDRKSVTIRIKVIAFMPGHSVCYYQSLHARMGGAVCLGFPYRDPGAVWPVLRCYSVFARFGVTEVSHHVHDHATDKSVGHRPSSAIRKLFNANENPLVPAHRVLSVPWLAYGDLYAVGSRSGDDDAEPRPGSAPSCPTGVTNYPSLQPESRSRPATDPAPTDAADLSDAAADRLATGQGRRNVVCASDGAGGEHPGRPTRRRLERG